MSTNEKKGVTVKIDADLHAEIKRYIDNDCVSGAGGAVPKNQRLSAAQQYDAEAVCDRADRE